MSERLSKAVKNEIIEKMVDYAFKSRLEEADALLVACCVEALETPQVLSLPPSLVRDGWIRSSGSLQILLRNRNGAVIESDYGLSLSKSIPYREEYYHAVNIEEGSGLPIEKAWKARRDLKTEHSALKADLRSVMDAVSTVKRLVELLPAAKDFLPDSQKISALVPTQVIGRVSSYFKEKE
jgi:Nucleotide modification associated domain 5